MRITQTDLPEVLLIEPAVHSDNRGFLVVAFQDQEFGALGLPTHFSQDNHSRSNAGVIRALHYQLHSPQGKLVTAITGRIFDVAVDVRVNSPNFGRWVGVTLSAENPQYLWVPPGFAHGFAVLSDGADVIMKCSTPFVADDQYGIRWDDPDIGIPWPVAHPILSALDYNRIGLHEATADLPVL